jgi:hypothetical protein
MWIKTGGGSDGLQSRFVLSFSDTPMPRVKTPNDPLLVTTAVSLLKEAIDNVPPVIDLPDEVGAFTEGLAGDGNHIDPRYTRVVDMGRRFALIIAACNGKTKIDAYTMKLAQEFINYQLAAYEPLMPEDAGNAVQMFEHRIVSFFKRHQPASIRDLRNNLKPNKSKNGFGTFQSAVNNLIKTRVLIPSGDANRVGTVRYKLDEGV